MNQEIAKKILNKVRIDYSRIAPDFSQTRQTCWEEMCSFAKHLKSGDRVLDLGCGNGRLYNILGEKLVDYTGVDNSAELINFAKQSCGEDDNRKFIVGDAVNLDWWDGRKYDAVFLIAVLHHIPSRELREKVLENAVKVLKDGGLLMMTNWNLFRTKYRRFIIKNILKKIIGKNEMDFMDALIPWKKGETGEILADRYVHAFTLRELKGLVKEVGLVVVENFYSASGGVTNFWNGRNLVTIAKK